MLEGPALVDDPVRAGCPLGSVAPAIGPVGATRGRKLAGGGYDGGRVRQRVGRGKAIETLADGE